MTVATREDALFSEWSAGRKNFNPDGMVNESRFNAAPIKLIYLLKDVNAPKGSGFDLRDFLRKGGRAHTWNNVTRWTEGIFRLREGETAVPWEALESVDESRRTNALNQICAMNLKKAAGGHTTDLEQLSGAARDDSTYLRKQLALYDADFTICCGSAVTAAVQHHQVLGMPMEDRQWRRTTRGIWYISTEQHGHVIAYSHPAARISSNLLLYGLLDAVEEILATEPA